MLQIVEAMRKETGFDFRYNIVGRRYVVSVLFLKWPIPLTTMAIRRGDVPDLTANPTLAEEELGFRAKKDLTTMCRDLWNWQVKNPGGYGTD